MYIYDNTEETLTHPLCWFATEGRSVYESLTMIKNGYLGQTYHKMIGDTLYIGVYNIYGLYFTSGKKYYLYIEPSKANYSYIIHKFDETE